jgi:uncharacterized membrane protein
LSTARLEAFADGVFAIAATLLILNVDGQIPSDVHDLGAQLTHIWPSYLAYAVGFATIGVTWINHHTILGQVERADRRFLVANIGLLMCIAFVPFPIRLVAEHVRGAGARDAALVYGLTMVAMAVMFNFTWFYASKGGRLLRADADPGVVSGLTRAYLPGPWVYLAVTLVAFVSPAASVIMFLVLTVVYLLESSIFGSSSEPATL